MPKAAVNGIELAYEVHGPDDGEPLVLVMGLGSTLVSWDVEFVAGLVDRGFRPVRFDNRDVGLSTKLDTVQVNMAEQIMRAMAGEAVDAPYDLSDMADDTAGLLDHLGIASAHVVGASMGGMIAQTLAIGHPGRVRTLTSIMSTTGDLDVGQASAEAAAVLLQRPANDREGAIANALQTWRVIGSPDHFDPERVRRRAGAAYDRCYHPAGVGRQLLAVAASGSRTADLRELSVPTLVIHGELDPLVHVSGGRRTAEAVPGAQLLVIEGMGHDLEPVFWSPIIEAITALAAGANV
jgi:pimeloyl-ACP methyl ester carboxylesterase